MALSTVLEEVRGLEHVRLIRFVLSANGSWKPTRASSQSYSTNSLTPPGKSCRSGESGVLKSKYD